MATNGFRVTASGLKAIGIIFAVLGSVTALILGLGGDKKEIHNNTKAREEIIEPTIKDHGERIVRIEGDQEWVEARQEDIFATLREQDKKEQAHYEKLYDAIIERNGTR